MYATFRILNGVYMTTRAVQMGTSIGMLEKHYSKLKAYMKLATLNGVVSPRQESSRLEAVIAKQQETINQLTILLGERKII